MITVCWSVKGGSGVTVTSTALALLRARASTTPVLLVDPSGDAATVLGGGPHVSDSAGLHDWFAADESVSSASLAQLIVEGPGGLQILPTGRTSWSSPPSMDRVAGFTGWLESWPGDVIVDLGADSFMRRALLEVADESLLVLRCCYLAGQAALRSERANGIILIEEPGRMLSLLDLSAALATPVVARIPLDISIANAVDSGSLSVRLPRPLARSLRPLIAPRNERTLRLDRAA